MIKIAIIGYGHMGKVLEKIAPTQGLEVVAIIDPLVLDVKKISAETLGDAEVCIDFTTPAAALQNIEKISSLKKNMVIGTTGWHQHLLKVESMTFDNDIGLVYGANFSIGMNAFFMINKYAARLMNKLAQYDVWGTEIHHLNKKDSPSGTALQLAKIITKEIERKSIICTDKINRQICPEELHVSSSRVGNIPGIHTIGYDSPADTIELTHTARTREGFAIGACLAARWVINQKGCHPIERIVREIVRED